MTQPQHRPKLRARIKHEIVADLLAHKARAKSKLRDELQLLLSNDGAAINVHSGSPGPFTVSANANSVADLTTSTAVATPLAATPLSATELTTADLPQSSPERKTELVRHFFGSDELWSFTTAELLTRPESDLLEFKASARWGTNGARSRKASLVITKTISSFANSAGGTLLIGVTDAGKPCGLSNDYATFQGRKNSDAWLLWLTSVIAGHLGVRVLRRIRVRIQVIDNHEICRVDVPALDTPTWLQIGDQKASLWERLPNSTRQVRDPEVAEFIDLRFGILAT